MNNFNLYTFGAFLFLLTGFILFPEINNKIGENANESLTISKVLYEPMENAIVYSFKDAGTKTYKISYKFKSKTECTVKVFGPQEKNLFTYIKKGSNLIYKNQFKTFQTKEHSEKPIELKVNPHVKTLIYLDIINHPVIGWEAETKEYSGEKSVIQINPIDLPGLLGGLKDLFKRECKTEVSCSCENGSEINITCKCGQGAKCESITVPNCYLTPEGEEDCSGTKQICQGGCI